MSRFPKIDRPCPLSPDEQRAIAGHCSHCEKTVHALDGLDEAERRALLAAATGPICVSYRYPAPRRVSGIGGAIGRTIAATLLTTSATAYAGAPSESAPATPTVVQALQDVKETESLDGLDLVFVGGVDDPQQSLAEQDTTLPELPLRSVAEALDATAGEGADELDLEELDSVVIVGGGVSDPAEAQWVELDDALPALPMIAAADAAGAGPADGNGRR